MFAVCHNGTLSHSLFLIYTVLCLTSHLFLQDELISNLKNFVPQVRLIDIFAGRLIEVCHEVGT